MAVTHRGPSAASLDKAFMLTEDHRLANKIAKLLDEARAEGSVAAYALWKARIDSLREGIERLFDDAEET